MIYGFVSPGEPLLIGFNIPKLLRKSKKSMETFLKNMIFANLKIWQNPQNDIFGKDRHRHMMNIRLKSLGNLGDDIDIYQKA